MYTTILLYCLYWTSTYYTLHYHTHSNVRVVLLISSNVYIKVCGRECRYCGCVGCFQMNTLIAENIGCVSNLVDWQFSENLPNYVNYPPIF